MKLNLKFIHTAGVLFSTGACYCVTHNRNSWAPSVVTLNSVICHSHCSVLTPTCPLFVRLYFVACFICTHTLCIHLWIHYIPSLGKSAHTSTHSEKDRHSSSILCPIPFSCVLLGETSVPWGRRGNVCNDWVWSDLLLRNSSCTGGCHLFGSEFHFLRQSVVVGCCPFLNIFWQSSCTKQFEHPESNAWDFQIWDALSFGLYLLNFCATNFLSVSTLRTTLIIHSEWSSSWMVQVRFSGYCWV